MSEKGERKHQPRKINSRVRSAGSTFISQICVAQTRHINIWTAAKSSNCDGAVENHIFPPLSWHINKNCQTFICRVRLKAAVVSEFHAPLAASAKSHFLHAVINYFVALLYTPTFHSKIIALNHVEDEMQNYNKQWDEPHIQKAANERLPFAAALPRPSARTRHEWF